MPERRHRRALYLAATVSAMSALAATHAVAGPPFATDDPQPTDYKHFEIYLYSEGTRAAGDTTGTLPGFEVNYGAAPNLQISVAIPLAYDKGENHGARVSYGATEIGLKYRFVEEDENGWRPQVSFYPSAEIPIGDSDRSTGIGGGHTRFFLPLWSQKSFGPWTTFGGGGYWINPGKGDKNYWFMGWAVQRQITPCFSLGVEAFHQSRDSVGGEDSTGMNVGGVYDLSERWHLVGSVGTGIQNRKTTNQFSYYTAIEWTPSAD